MANLELFLLGPTQVMLDGAYIEVKPRKAFALLIYLAVTAERHSRDSLATFFWPESNQRNARKSLRSRLSELNLTLGEDWIEADRESIALRDGYWSDTAEFQHMLNEKVISTQTLMKASDLYRDDFMTGFTLPDCPEFDDWQFFQAESLRQSFASTLEMLIQKLSNQQDFEAAIPYGRRWLALDPLHEPAHRKLMQLYAQSGQQAAALRQYDQCRQILEDELGISPSQKTRVLYQDIQAGKFKRRELRPQTQHNLPVQTSTFIGRENEIENIKHLLIEEPGCRLLNLVGPGGVGKTRLALATAVQLLNTFPDGVFFVSLAPVSETEDIAPTIAEALNFIFYGQEDPKTQLLDYLTQKKMLIVADNFEHLMGGANLLSEIMSQAPDVTLLVTSRERLNVQEEWGYDVQGLPFPVESTIDQAEEAFLDKYSSIELFLQRARRANARFSPSGQETADIIRICQHVDGTPLGIELAAPWIRTMSCREIADEIERSLDFLTTSIRNIPERHRSLRVVFEQTWERLSSDEQTALQKLSVFRGGCTRKAAEQVTGATLPVLASLVDKALLHRNNLGRYELHELIRQFAKSKLLANPQTAAQAQQRHQDYFVEFLEKRTAGVDGARQKETISEIKTDMENVRLAWRRAVANRDVDAIDRSVECLYIFYIYSSGHYEGQAAFQQAVSALTTVPDSPASTITPQNLHVQKGQENLVGFLLATQTYMLARISGNQVVTEEVVADLLREKPRNKRREAIALGALSMGIRYQGRTDDAKRYAELGLSLAVETGSFHGHWWNLTGIAVPLYFSHPLKAKQLLTEALEVCQRGGDLTAQGFSNQNLARALVELGSYSQATQHLDQSLLIFTDLDNLQGLGYGYEDIGRLEVALGDYKRAIQNFYQSIEYLDETRSTLHINHCQVWLGNAYRLNGDYQKAEETSKAMLVAFNAIQDAYHSGYCLLYLGLLAQDQGDIVRAERLLKKALATWKRAELDARIADAARYLGHLMVAMGEHRYGEAIDYFRQGLEGALEHKLTPLALDVCVGAAHLLAHVDEMDRAVELLGLTEHHEASTFETKKRARRLLTELEAQSQIGIIGKAIRSDIDIWVVASDLSADLKNLEAVLAPPFGLQKPHHNLPVQTTSFIGREKEVADIKRLLLEEPDCRLLTLVGPGGIGKTRLALAAAVQIRDDFPDGVFFIPLAPISEPEFIVPAIAESLRLIFYGNVDPKENLLDYLSRRQLLLFVDNLEHLQDGTALLSDIISHAPEVLILATSRERLNLREEWVFEVQGLDYPSGNGRTLNAYSATELFLQRAHQAMRDFAPTEAEMADIGRICQLVAGMPLGIELAAPWIKFLSCREIAAEIESSLDFLDTTVQNVPDRHRSLRLVFEQTWERLSEQEKSMLRQLSVFRGGCTRDAAERVTDATLPVLSSLVDKALLRRNNTGRYELHELIRQFAEGELSIIEKTETTHDVHCTYFADFLHQRESDFKGPRQKVVAEEIAADLKNILIAWNWAIKQIHVELLDKAMGSLGYVHEWYGRYQEGEQAFALAADNLAEIDTIRGQRVLANLLIWRAIFGELLGKNKEVGQLLHQAQTLLETSKLAAQDTRKEQVAILMGLGRVAYNNRDFQNAGRLYEQSLTLYRDLRDRWGEARALLAVEGVGRNFLESGNPNKHIQQTEASRKLVLESLAIFRDLDDMANIARSSLVLGMVFFSLGQAAEALSALKECIAICKRLGRLNNNVLILALGNLGLVKGWFFGLYDQMRSEGQKILALAQDLNYSEGKRFGLGIISLAALPQGKYKETYQIYQESLQLKESGNSVGSHLAGYATHQLGRKNQARQYLYESLKISRKTRAIRGALYGLPLAAMILTDRDEIELAIEIQALAWSFPVVANSRLLEDIAGQYLLTIASTLPSNVVTAAQARGSMRDLWTTIDELLTAFTDDESDGNSFSK